MTNKEKLKELIAQYKLSTREVCELLNVSDKTVFSWLTDKKWVRKISDQTIELLKYKLKER